MKMKFGEFKGQEVSDLPLYYLMFLNDAVVLDNDELSLAVEDALIAHREKQRKEIINAINKAWNDTQKNWRPAKVNDDKGFRALLEFKQNYEIELSNIDG